MDDSRKATGLSHSEILGSKVICTYPKLIAAYHVLHRLREPRHPPSALVFLMTIVDHTFSCTLPSHNPCPKGQKQNGSERCSFFLTTVYFACVNMSKSDIIKQKQAQEAVGTTKTPINSYLHRHIIHLQKGGVP